MERYTLGRAALAQIQQLVRKEMQQVQRQLRGKGEAPPASQAIYLAKSPAGGVDAMVSDTPGSARVTVQRINPDGDVEEVQLSNGTPLTVTAYNVSQSAVAANTIIQLKQELGSGCLLIDFEDCG